MYWVYKHVPRRGSYPHCWLFVSKHDDILDARRAALKIVGTRDMDNTYTEPGNGLDHAFFGTRGPGKWRAMIDTRDIFDGVTS